MADDVRAFCAAAGVAQYADAIISEGFDTQPAGTVAGSSRLRRVRWMLKVRQPRSMRAAPRSPTRVLSAWSGVRPRTRSVKRRERSVDVHSAV